MSVGDLFGEDLWKRVGDDLRGMASAWWKENRDHLIGLTKDEVQAIANSLKAGSTYNAKMEIAARMSREEWEAYRDGTTDQLRGIATHRAEVLEALEDIGKRVARIIGAAVIGALAA